MRILFVLCLLCISVLSSTDAVLGMVNAAVSLYKQLHPLLRGTPPVTRRILVREPEKVFKMLYDVPIYSYEAFVSNLESTFKKQIDQVFVLQCPSPNTCEHSYEFFGGKQSQLSLQDDDKIELIFASLGEVTSAVVGIDFGTTGCRVSLSEDGVSRTLYEIPSAIAYSNNGYVFGDTAQRMYFNDCRSGIMHMKQILGHTWEHSTVVEFRNRCNNLKEGPDGLLAVLTYGKKIHEVPLVFLASLLFAKLKQGAEGKLRKKLINCVVTIPAGASDIQMHTTKIAAEMAGWTVRQLVHEPSMAAFRVPMSGDLHHVITLDLGGGTYDMALLTKYPNNTFRERALHADPLLGGVNFTLTLAQYLQSQFRDLKSWTESYPEQSVFYDLAETAKKDLGENSYTHIAFPFSNVALSLDRPTVKKIFEGLLKLLEHRTTEFRELIRTHAPEVLTSKAALISLFAVGGGTLYAPVIGVFEKVFSPLKTVISNGGSEISQGAAMFAQHPVLKFQAVTFTSLYREVIFGKFGDAPERWRVQPELIIPRFTALPHRAIVRSHTAYPNQKSVQGAMWAGQVTGRGFEGLQKIQSVRLNIHSKPQQVDFTRTYDLDASGKLQIKLCQDGYSRCESGEIDLTSVIVSRDSPNADLTKEDL